MDTTESYERAYVDFVNYQTKTSIAFQAIQHITSLFVEESTDDRIHNFVSSFVSHTCSHCDTCEQVMDYIRELSEDAERTFHCETGSIASDIMADTLLSLLTRQLEQVERVILTRGHLCKENTYQYMIHKRKLTLYDIGRVVAECIFYEESPSSSPTPE